MKSKTSEKVLTLEDGSAAKVGDTAYNYYDMEPVLIVAIDDQADPINQTWCDVRRVDGQSTYTLSDSRMCSIATAKARGWKL